MSTMTLILVNININKSPLGSLLFFKMCASALRCVHQPHVHTAHTCTCLLRPGEGLWSPGVEVTDSCKLHSTGSGNQTGPSVNVFNHWAISLAKGLKFTPQESSTGEHQAVLFVYSLFKPIREKKTILWLGVSTTWRLLKVTALERLRSIVRGLGINGNNT